MTRPEFDPLCGDGTSLLAAYAYLLALAVPEPPHITPPETGSNLHQYDGDDRG